MKIDTVYPELVDRVLTSGQLSSPRGKVCRVLHNVTTVLDAFPNVPYGIGFNKKFAIAELMGIVAGHNNVEWLAQFNPNVRQFANGPSFDGHYGERLEGQWHVQIERLRQDPATRQAIFQIWDPVIDGLPGSKDYPCNVAFQLYSDHGRLHMTIFQRSSDLIWGFPYDHFVFGCILHSVALGLGLGTGLVTRHVTNMHVYEPGVYYPKARIDARPTRWESWLSTSFYRFAGEAMHAISGQSNWLSKDLGLCE